MINYMGMCGHDVRLCNCGRDKKEEFLGWVKQYRIQNLKESIATLWDHLEKNPEKKTHQGYVSDFNNLMNKIAEIDPTTPAFRLPLPTVK